MRVLNRETPSLFQALIPSLPEKRPYLLTAVGGGGKTTLLNALGEEARSLRLPTLLTTTTHMRVTPEADLSGTVSTILRKLEESCLCFCGVPADDGKLTGLPSETFAELFPHCTLALVEGDGSRGLPLKFPGPEEPVLPAQTDQILLVCGMSAMGRRLDQVCHRWPLSGFAGDTLVTPETAAAIVKAGYLARLPREKTTVVFHQCNSPLQEAAARALARQLGLERYLLTRRG